MTEVEYMIKAWSKSALRILGLEVSRTGSPQSPSFADPYYVQRSLLEAVGALTGPTILDIGAYTGETVEQY